MLRLALASALAATALAFGATDDGFCVDAYDFCADSGDACCDGSGCVSGAAFSEDEENYLLCPDSGHLVNDDCEYWQDCPLPDGSGEGHCERCDSEENWACFDGEGAWMWDSVNMGNGWACL